MKQLVFGFYALWIHLPLSGLSRRWRRASNSIRAKKAKLLQDIRLPGISWRACARKRFPRLLEPDKANGNIRVSELGVISAIAAGCDDGSSIFEIGTFDGRTSLNLAFSSPARCKIFTLDLKPEMHTKYPLEHGERHMVEKETPAARIAKYRNSNDPFAKKIHQLFGDSASFDFSPYHASCSLVFVDGSHSYDYALSDTLQALKLAKRGGVILWHDYGIWQGVTKALEEFEGKDKLGLRNISGTSLVYWKKQ